MWKAELCLSVRWQSIRHSGQDAIRSAQQRGWDQVPRIAPLLRSILNDTDLHSAPAARCSKCWLLILQSQPFLLGWGRAPCGLLWPPPCIGRPHPPQVQADGHFPGSPLLIIHSLISFSLCVRWRPARGSRISESIFFNKKKTSQMFENVVAEPQGKRPLTSLASQIRKPTPTQKLDKVNFWPEVPRIPKLTEEKLTFPLRALRPTSQPSSLDTAFGFKPCLCLLGRWSH